MTSAPGMFFVDSYSFLALLIPAYLVWAAHITADPVYRPKRIFVLGLSVIPFLTLAAGLKLLRDFYALAQGHSLLTGLGQIGIGFCAVIMASLEGFLIWVGTVRLFNTKNRKPGSPEKKPGAASERAGKSGSRPLLPAPRQPLRNSAETSVQADAPEDDRAALSAGNRKKEPPPDLRTDHPVVELSLAERPLSERFLRNAETGGTAKRSDREEDPPAEIGEFFSVPPAARLIPVSEPEEPEEFPGEFDETDDDGTEEPPPPLRPGPAQMKVYQIPVEGLLTQYPDGQYWIIDQATRDAANTLRATLEEFHIQAEVTGIRKGPVITMFEILPAPGVKLSKIVSLQDNIALRMAASSVRIVAPIPGKHAVGIEVPNKRRNIVSFRELIEGEMAREDKKDGRKWEIPVVLGKDIAGEAQTVDLVQMPHLLIAGSTGSGKSVCVNTMILSILYRRAPAECRLIMIDPKIVELKLYNDIPHLLTPVITEPKRAFQALQYCIFEMERRYACLDSMGVRDIRSYNRRIRERSIAAEHMPYIVVVIDEFADLMATTGKELESTVARLAAMSRAVGIHLVLATQRPSIDVITGLIKANIPSRIAFMVASKMDSRIIIDMVGAEKLLGKGDMLYAGAVDPFPVRMQGAFVSEDEVERVVEYVKGLGEPDYIDDEIFIDDDDEASDTSLFSDGDDPLYDKALEIVIQQGKASASYIQRRLKIGYNRAARLVEEMEQRGVVGPAQGSKPRELLRGV
ncbi:MAG: DNA translocase FtsK [Treponema sp.]|nr:DNA translocase FtsK [Treponema sp.]